MGFVECLDTHFAFCNVAFIRGFINGGIQQAIMRAKGARGKAPKNLDYSQNNLPSGMGLNVVGSAPSLVQNFFQLVSAKNRTKGEKGEGANRTFAQLPQSATRCRTTMGNMGEESEEKTVGERGERPVFVGFS